MKKRSLTLIAVSALISVSVNAECGIKSVIQDGQNVTVSFTSDSDSVNLAVVKELPEGVTLKPAEKHKRYVLAADAADGGAEVYRFVMPEEYAGESTTGFYTVAVKGADEDKAEKRFYYLNTADRNEFLNTVKAYTDTTEIETAVSEKNDTYYKLAALGFPMDFLNEGNAHAIASEFIESKPAVAADKLKYTFAESVALELIRQNEDISEIFAYSDLQFDGEKYTDIKDADLKSFISGYFSENAAEITDGADIHSGYKSANVLYILRKARSGNMTGLLDANKEALGLTDMSSYGTYTAMTSSKKSDVNDKLVSALSGTPVYRVLQFKEIFANAVADVSGETAEVIVPTGGGKGSGGGGGGGRGGSGGGSYAFTKDETDAMKSGENTATGSTDNGNADISFDDLENVGWAKNAILSLAKKGIINGIGDNKFNPESQVKREEFVKIIVLALNAKTADTARFTDVPSDAWYAPYVGAAVRDGICNGISESEFGTGAYLTREDAVAMLYRAFGNRLNPTRDAKEFADSGEISDYAKAAVTALYSAGAVDGTDGETFSPKRLITRAEAAKIIYGLTERN